MSDHDPEPPLPLSPYAPAPASPSPKALNHKAFWRHILRRVSRSNPIIPDHQLSQPPSSNLLQLPLVPPPPAHPPTALVEIQLPHPPQTHRQRTHGNHPINGSAFDDLPPPQLYHPAWNTNPLRGEHGRLGSQTTGPATPLLPGAFTIKSSDLEDEDDDDSQHNSDPSTTLTSTTPSPSSHPDHTPVPDPSRNNPPNKSTVFHSPHSLNTTIEHLTIVLERQMKAHIISIKSTDIRARVPFRANDNNNNFARHIIILSLERSSASVRVSVRRSFADTFRISMHDLDVFCEELQKRFGDLQQLATR